jgi:hypothetical protein
MLENQTTNLPVNAYALIRPKGKEFSALKTVLHTFPGFQGEVIFGLARFSWLCARNFQKCLIFRESFKTFLIPRDGTCRL